MLFLSPTSGSYDGFSMTMLKLLISPVRKKSIACQLGARPRTAYSRLVRFCAVFPTLLISVPNFSTIFQLVKSDRNDRTILSGGRLSFIIISRPKYSNPEPGPRARVSFGSMVQSQLKNLFAAVSHTFRALRSDGSNFSIHEQTFFH